MGTVGTVKARMMDLQMSKEGASQSWNTNWLVRGFQGPVQDSSGKAGESMLESASPVWRQGDPVVAR
eukprot:854661-Pyramimonas_sp.AAC.1